MHKDALRQSPGAKRAGDAIRAATVAVGGRRLARPRPPRRADDDAVIGPGVLGWSLTIGQGEREGQGRRGKRVFGVLIRLQVYSLSSFCARVTPCSSGAAPPPRHLLMSPPAAAPSRVCEDGRVLGVGGGTLKRILRPPYRLARARSRRFVGGRPGGKASNSRSLTRPPSHTQTHPRQHSSILAHDKPIKGGT